MARHLGDPETLFNAASRAMTGPPQYHAERFRLAEEFISAPHEGVSAKTLAQVLQYGVWSFVVSGDRSRAEEEWRQMAELGERTRHPWPMLVSLEQEVIFATIDGRLDEALAAGERLVATAEKLGVPGRGRQRLVRLIVRALLYLGRLEEAMAFIDQLRQPSQRLERQLNSIETDRSVCLAHLGRKEEAREVLYRFLDEQDLRSEENESPGALVGNALETAVLIEDRQVTEAVAGRLARSGGSAISCGGAGRVNCPGRHMGEAAVLLGRPDEARTRYDWALESCEQIRYRPEVAIIRMLLAELLLDHYPDERAEAIEHLDFAIAEFGEMKMQPSLERAMARQQSLEN